MKPPKKEKKKRRKPDTMHASRTNTSKQMKQAFKVKRQRVQGMFARRAVPFDIVLCIAN